MKGYCHLRAAPQPGPLTDPSIFFGQTRSYSRRKLRLDILNHCGSRQTPAVGSFCPDLVSHRPSARDGLKWSKAGAQRPPRARHLNARRFTNQCRAAQGGRWHHSRGLASISSLLVTYGPRESASAGRGACKPCALARSLGRWLAPFTQLHPARAVPTFARLFASRLRDTRNKAQLPQSRPCCAKPILRGPPCRRRTTPPWGLRHESLDSHKSNHTHVRPTTSLYIPTRPLSPSSCPHSTS